MSDPLSVAGSAVGIISLGLSVCGEIVDYGRAYRGFDEDIQNITAKADSLNDTLEDLKDAIKSSQDTQSQDATKLSKKVIGIKQHITRLDSMLKRYGPDTTAQGFTQKARNQVKKTVYAFRKDALREMAAEMESLQKNLQTALNVYIWKQNCQVLQKMERMEMLLVRDNGKIPPSLLKDCCEGQEKLHSELTSSSDSLSYLHSIRQGKRSLTKRYRSYSWFLGHAIELSFNMTTGAGGFSIYPSLKAHTIFSCKDPTYRHLKSLLYSIRRGENFEDDFQTLKNLLSDRKIDLSWTIYHGFSTSTPVIEEIFRCLVDYAVSQSTDLQHSRLIEFLLAIWGESGRPEFSLLIEPLFLFLVLGSEENLNIPFMMRLSNLGFGFHIPDTRLSAILAIRCGKAKLLSLVSNPVSFTQMPPENIRLICRQNTAELRQALQEKRILPNEFIEYSLPLQWAFGWPEGVQILLDHGADPTHQELHIANITDPGTGFHSSAEILLRAGCCFYMKHLDHALDFKGGEKRMLLLANELAARRMKLRSYAEKVLPLHLIPDSGGSKLLDGPDCRKLLDVLLAHKISLPHSFTSSPDQFLNLVGDSTVYHHIRKKQCAEALYQLGFLDTDTIDSKGKTPLGAFDKYDSFGTGEELTGIIRWHITKDTNLDHSLAWTNESISHHLTLIVVQESCCSNAWREHSDTRLESYLNGLIELGDDFFASMRRPDGCACPCSPNGCTAISSVLREFTAGDPMIKSGCIECERKILETLYKWDESYWQNPRAFIRSLTFNALDLNHTCFSNIKKGCVLDMNVYPDYEEFVNDERDEESALNEFEELVTHLEQKFVERGQPLKDFVPDYWYRCVKDHLLTRQPHDEGHVAGARSVGVDLEFCGLSVPDWMEDWIPRKVEEVNDEDEVEEQGD